MQLNLSDFRLERADLTIIPRTPSYLAHKRCSWYVMLDDHTTLEVVMTLVAEHAATHA